MSDNPYAPPQVEKPFLGQPGASHAGLWRDGRLLVMHRQAELPDRCVKSNEPAHGRRLKRNLSWHHPAVYLALLANILIYAILATVLGKRATIQIGLTQQWIVRRRWRMLIAWLLVLLCSGLFVAGIMLSDSLRENAVWPIVLGGVGVIAAAVYGVIACRLVHPKKMSDEYIWLQGVHPDFLAALPPWPGL
ncbi:MAG: hypothetical protein J5I93_14785 [Pirellulaceae bacterium]|nr:hypothetical protein [Pirellulaceae bacterium]